jgi:hypothetical protein
MVFYQKGEYRVALALQKKVLDYFFEIRSMEHLLKTIESVAMAVNKWATQQQAISFFAFSRCLQESMNQERSFDPDYQEAERMLESLRGQFSPLEFELAWQAGWHWTLEETIKRIVAIE